jgi:lipoprotein signal peptidase
VSRSRQGLGIALALTGVVFVADQVSKWLVRHDADHLPYRVVGGLRVDLNFNRGISFSQLAQAGAVVTALVAAVAAGVIAALVFVAPRYRPALGLILGGALGNLVDRLRFGGAVVDFIGVYGWPSFNVADMAIVAGTLILVVQVLRGARA